MSAKAQRAGDIDGGGDASSAALPAPPAASLRARLAAWWDGAPTAPHPAPATAANGKAAAHPAKGAGRALSATAGAWPPARIEIASLLWGEGFVGPLGGDAISALAEPLALEAGEVLLDVSAGLGGAARALAARHHLRVTAMVPSAGFAAAAAALSEALGTGKEVATAGYDPRTADFKRGVADAALAHELLSTLEDKEALLRRVALAMKPQGRLLIADYMLSGRTPGATVAGWAAVDPAPVHPWTLDDARKCLAKLHIDVTAANDETARLRAAITGGLDAFVKSADAGALTPDRAKHLAREIALWASRKEALDAGELRFVCLYGEKAGEPG